MGMAMAASEVVAEMAAEMASDAWVDAAESGERQVGVVDKAEVDWVGVGVGAVCTPAGRNPHSLSHMRTRRPWRQARRPGRLH